MNNYVAENLKAKEQVIKLAEIHPLSKIIFMILAIAMIVIALIMSVYAHEIWPFAIFSPFILGFSIGFLKEFLYMKTTVLTLTDKRVFGKIGSFSVKTVDYPIDKINSIVINQDIFGRIFNFGTIIIQTASSSDLKVSSVKNPNAFKQEIINQQDNKN